MRSLDNITRVNEVDQATLRAYAARREPVVISRFLGDAPLARLRTLEAVREALGALVLTIRHHENEGVFAPELRADAVGTDLLRLDEFLTRVEQHPSWTAKVSELETPSAVHALFSPPPAIYRPHARRDQMVSQVFCAGAGNYAHLHFDGDYREVVLYQVFGRKRVTVISPTQAPKLMPFMNFSTVFLQRMSESERDAFLRFVDARECVLAPGEAIYIPMLSWHAIDYVDTGMSLNFRFGQSRYGAFFAQRMHLDAMLQNLAVALARREDAAACFEEIVRLVDAPEGTPYERYLAVRRGLEALCARLCPELVRASLFAPISDAEARGRVEQFLSRNNLYTREG